MNLTAETKRKLLATLDAMTRRHQEVEQMLSDPALSRDSARLARIAREHGRLGKFVEKHDQLLQLRQLHREAEESLREVSDDEELRQLAVEEIEEAEREDERLMAELVELLVSDETEADRNVIMEIRAGTGGEEAALFASDLLGMYTRYAEKKGWKVEQMDISTTDLGGIREAVFSVAGDGAWNGLRCESGGHRVQRVPETESQGRIHTSLATVAVLPQVEEVEVEIDPNDLEMSFMRSSGPGGQHVNKTSSCVRIVHTPTGITVRCQDEKSQQANRKKAMKILRARLYEQQQREQHQERDAMRRSQVGSGDRNERIRTYNFPQDRITDHRIGLDVFGVESFLLGDCGQMFDALAEHHRQELIRAFAEAESPDPPTEQ
ncbi:MAG: peptide chain release factor 1 [Candidatus Brocadiae bacterium]|nr:peptide chain release factor 1 [Candidatus Brocadiia bacterium]